MSFFPLNASSAFGVTAQENVTIFMDLDQSSLGKTPKLVASAVRHLCGLNTPEDAVEPLSFDDYDEVARQYYGTIIQSDRTGKSALIFLSYLSTFFHELRHAHDLLATSYGQDILFLTLNCYQNVPGLLAELTKWQNKGLERNIPLPLSHINNTELPTFVRDVATRYLDVKNRITEFRAPRVTSPAGLTVGHLLEGSATEIQLGFIHELFGDQGLFELITLIQRSKGSRLYLQIRNEIIEGFSAKGFRDLREALYAMNYILWCALIGTTFPNKKLSEGPTNTVLYEALITYVLRYVKRMDFSEVQEIVISFYHKWGLLTPNQMIDRFSSFLDNRAGNLEQLWRQNEVNVPKINFTNAYRSFSQSYRSFTQWIQEHPSYYFKPEVYGWAVVSGFLPSVYILVKFEGEIHGFMTDGRSGPSLEEWQSITNFSTIFKLFFEGRNRTPLSFFEDKVFEYLRETGLKFRIKDSRFPF
jgi:hypothetical protein